ncbi:MAG: DEAD/DEAH box helicase [Candidatus Lokiarchaeota archaeon]|nr:DEAD/DEAH box helicase [Candidatus Lokiarchaeota archaeon]
MSVPSRNFFIVLDRNRERKKELLFDVNFFYLKSFKKKRFTFTYVNEPFFKGTVKFGLDFKNKMRPLNFNKIEKDGSSQPINPRLLRKFFLSDKNKFIAFSNQTSTEDILPVREMLSGFQYDTDKIINLTICDSCLDKKKFTLLNENLQIKSLKNQTICSECSYEIVVNRIKLTGMISKEKISPKLKNFLMHMILKFKDLKKVLDVFRADFDPVRSREITLYDIEKTPSISKKYLNQKIDNLDIPPMFKEILKGLNLTILLPIQAISIEKGLLTERRNQLIMAPTSGGKTLVGELAGISKVLNDRNSKMLYLVPIVALANIRTEEFKEKYKSIKLKVIKRVGESLFGKREEDNIKDLANAHVVIATYEAIDYILRSGNRARLGDIGTIIVDEIQTLIDPERGFILDGLIARLKTQFDSHFLYLSATLGEPKLLAEKLNCELIKYNNRPVPIERHLLLCLNETQKQKYISKLIRAAYSMKSVYGFKGQTIVFTNTRKKCESISSYLQNRGIKVSPYHSGLTNEERKIIEEMFQSQRIMGVVATAALAAGVDLPASQVIFESLAMGINWLSVAEFEQMLGRSGRLKKHEKGLAYILVEPGKVYSPKMKITEENIAIKLLNGKIKDYELIPDEDKSKTEILAFIAMFNQWITKDIIFEFYNHLINNHFDLEEVLKKLILYNLIRIKEDLTVKITRLGGAVASSFLTIDECLDIIKKLQKKLENPLDIALNLEFLRNVYLSKNLVADLSKNVNMKYFSNNLFSASVLSLMNADYVKKRKTFSRDFIDFIMKLTSDIFNCTCNDNPYCDCGRLNLEKLILNLRVKEKMTIEEISNYLIEEYKILVFKGDLIDYLENLIYSLESIKNIAEGISNLDENYIREIKKIPILIENIKY